MYREHFQLQEEPFSLTPNTSFFCNLPNYQEALNVLYFCINQGIGFTKIIGEVGYGKTLICRKLITTLEPDIITAYLPNPDLDAHDLRYAIAHDLGLDQAAALPHAQLLPQLTAHLIQLRQQGKKVLIIIDEAQALPDTALEALRLLSNLETESEKLLQIILFAQPELDNRLERSEFRQLKQRILFSYTLRPLTRQELSAYINHRLAIAGFTHGNLFSPQALAVLYKNSRGVPRLVNNFCYKALLVAYGKGAKQINKAAMHRAIEDSLRVLQKNKIPRIDFFILTGLLSLIALLMAISLYHYF